MQEITKVLKSWAFSGALTQLNRGATPEAIALAQSTLERSFPEDFIECYRHTDGASVLEGNIGLHPLRGDELSVTTASDFSRNAEWPIPDELVLFGDNGAGSPLGLWLPRNGIARPLVVEVGELFEPKCMAIVGTSFERFLKGRTAYYLALLEAPKSALDELGVPALYRSTDLGDDEFDALARWADPNLPALPLDPYNAKMDAAAVNAFAQMAG